MLPTFFESATVLAQEVSVETVGQWVRRWREARGLSRRELVERVGMPYSTLASVEDGHNDVSRAAFVRLADALIVPEGEWPAGMRAPVRVEAP